MRYLIEKLLEFRNYKEDINGLFEVFVAYSKGENITKTKLLLNSDQANYIGRQFVILANKIKELESK